MHVFETKQVLIWVQFYYTSKYGEKSLLLISIQNTGVEK